MIPKYNWQLDSDNCKIAQKEAYYKIGTIRDFTVRHDLYKILENASNLFSEIMQEEVYCRTRSKQSNAHKRLVVEYAELVKILDEHIVWGMLID